MRRDLLDLVYERDELADLDAAQRRLALRAVVADAGLDPSLVSCIADEIDGYGPISELMRDELVTDVLINAYDDVWIERGGDLSRTDVTFGGPQQLATWIERMFARARARVDASSPIADARLEDGSRIHAVLSPIAPAGPVVSIRRFPRARPSLDELTGMGGLTEGQRELLRAAVAAKKTIAIGGATGSGKTTLMNALLGCVDPSERIVAIEETPELLPSHPHVVRLVARPPNLEGAGRVDLSDLVRAALRMRPDRIVVGEVRGSEALDALAVMSTGHRGSMVTIHARSPGDVVARFVSCALSARAGPIEESLERRVRATFDVVVHLVREHGARRVAAIEGL
ncbi:MAG: CpaF family protein [Actinomycetota bacterium]